MECIVGLLRVAVALALLTGRCDGQRATVPALFVFGDSLVDTGNNAGLNTVARAMSPPYESDFSGGGGRFSNGRITTDFIADALKLASPPPYVDVGDNVEHGVNFASAGCGILDTTGSYFGEHYSMGTQISNFADVKERLTRKLGSEKASHIISKSIFYITAGSNDYLVTYYALPPDPNYSLYSPSRFSAMLIYNLSAQLERLYNLGARKFAVTSIPNIGCVPYAVRLYSESEKDELQCVKFMNDAAKAYNNKFFKLIDRLQDRYPDAHFIANHAYEAAVYTLTNAAAYGIVEVTDACCNLGENLQGICLEGFQVCTNASQYFYFDGFHPTSPVHHITAETYVTGTSAFVTPLNLQVLASL